MASRIALASVVVAFGAAACWHGEIAVETETVEMVPGAYRTVANSRAEILIGEVGDHPREGTGLTAPAVEVKVSCGEEEKWVRVFEDRLTDPVCRVQLRVEEILSWSPPKVRLKVFWIEP
jgi:hypothetical protein